jgi:hypothetical protein
VLLFIEKNVSLCYHLKLIFMALAIKRAPVLRGKAARDFQKKLEMSSKNSSESGEELEKRAEETRKWREFLSRQRAML